MPTIDIPEETYRRLTRRAAALHTTVESLALPALEGAACEPVVASAPAGVPRDEWQAGVRKRADRYPPGFRADASRESIYEGCGE